MRARRRQSATTIMSFALVAPAFFFLIFAISEGARIFNAYVVITNEAREAARYGAVHYDSTQTPTYEQAAVTQYLYQRLNGSLDPSGLAPAPRVVVTPGSATVAPMVDVTVTYRVQLIIPMIAGLLPNPFPIQTRSIMVGEPGS